ncbi:MAG: hypothetical protein IKV20_04185 [Clostridia bacterium]|nr:hypothetical protein [Clostridia bacterium]
MKSSKITSAEIADMKISALPTRPTAPAEFGGRGYTAAQMKEAFDKLPLYVIERFNALIDDIREEGGGSITDAIPTGITEAPTLKDMLADIKSGEMCAYLKAPSGTLSEYLLTLRQDIDKIAEHLKITL